MRIRSDGLVLTVDEHPEADLVLVVVEVMGDATLENAVGLLLEDAEAGELRWRPVLLVERCKVKAFVLGESVIGDNLGRQEQVLLLPLLLLGLQLNPLFVKAALYQND